MMGCLLFGVAFVFNTILVGNGGASVCCCYDETISHETCNL